MTYRGVDEKFTCVLAIHTVCGDYQRNVIEIKSSENVGDRTKGLHLFQEERKCRKSLIVSRDPVPRKLTSNITVLPWHIFCEMLWEGEII
jgi:hypothetical protein